MAENKYRLTPGVDYYLMQKVVNKTIRTFISTDKFITKNACIIGGFHTLCADVGEIPGHPLSGFLAGDILPHSLWNLHHRARCENNDGMVYDPGCDIWVDIYLLSEIGPIPGSFFGGKIINNRKHGSFANDMLALQKRMLSHVEFSSAADGSNELTCISDRRLPGGTGGHRDVVGRRMISNIGCEDMCGVVWQWLSDSPPDCVGGVGALLAGGDWTNGTHCGSRSRNAGSFRWAAYATIGARFASEPLKKRALQQHI